ncbi:hypothetical protein E1B28_011455 [Marasmius oreades]|uniref:Uncharacterized protein n=1 Tax=Marasmius oreades TaxID=181124 RepID=A0A9P7RUA4_9AGAR|nr:uncharacterized protein E1B28_011455 [Marasmius oreades]KAG7089805.1 hypothetical protein E1B28_011455 [Marasmius oreades]
MNLLDKYRTVNATPLPTVVLQFDATDSTPITDSQRAYDDRFKLEREVEARSMSNTQECSDTWSSILLLTPLRRL